MFTPGNKKRRRAPLMLAETIDAGERIMNKFEERLCSSGSPPSQSLPLQLYKISHKRHEEAIVV